ncbi:hypothetical protein BGW80DRAFT_47185 [Lactifluus volemus]|nr:hypothetical protein BGW80DRAFT_47185 [Lactifluus volemus]
MRNGVGQWKSIFRCEKMSEGGARGAYWFPTSSRPSWDGRRRGGKSVVAKRGVDGEEGKRGSGRSFLGRGEAEELRGR